jgi:hypothetical protein
MINESYPKTAGADGCFSIPVVFPLTFNDFVEINNMQKIALFFLITLNVFMLNGCGMAIKGVADHCCPVKEIDTA